MNTTDRQVGSAGKAQRATASTTGIRCSSTTFSSAVILPIDNCILTNETHSDNVSTYCDTNDDGKADKRDVFYTGVGVGRDGNVEHEQSGFIWSLDNSISSTYNSFRFRWTPRAFSRRADGAERSSWGLTQDDDGKMWFINAGAERGPVNFQFRFNTVR